MKTRTYLSLFSLSVIFFGLLLNSCNRPVEVVDTELNFTAPDELQNEVDSIQVTARFGEEEIILFSGKSDEENFSGPWTGSASDYNGEDLELTVWLFSSDGELIGSLHYTYTNESGVFVQQPALNFLHDSILVELQDSTVSIQWNLSGDSGNSATLTSSDAILLTITDNSIANLLDTGIVFVYANSVSGNLSDTLIIKIQNTLPDIETPIDSIRFLEPTLELNLSISKIPLQYQVFPVNHTDTVVCTSQNTDIVGISDNRDLVPFAEGTTTITCTNKSSTVSEVLTVTIVETQDNPSLDSIRFRYDNISKQINSEPFTPEFTLYPKTEDVTLIWSTSDPELALIDTNGETTVKKKGDVWIYVEAIGETNVKDSLLVQITDSTSNQTQLWLSDTIHVLLDEGDSATLDLSDSIADPTASEPTLVGIALSERASLSENIFSFKTGARDSGTYSEKIELEQNGVLDTLTIYLTVNPLYLTLTLNAENGTVSAQPEQLRYRFGDSVTLSPTPENGYGFEGWSGDNSSQTNPLVVLMDDNKTITASFTLIEVLECINLSSGESINEALGNIYSSPQKKGTLCPEVGVFDDGTIEVSGPLEFQIR